MKYHRPTAVKLACLFLFACICIQTNDAYSQTNWTGAFDADFNNAANWDNGVPNSIVDANFSLAGTNSVVLSLNAAADRMSVTLGTYNFQGGQTLSLAGDLTLSSTLSLDGTSISSSSKLIANGIFSASNASGSSFSSIDIDNGGISATGMDTSIVSTGYLTVKPNGGSIDVDQGASLSTGTATLKGSNQSRYSVSNGGSWSIAGDLVFTDTTDELANEINIRSGGLVTNGNALLHDVSTSQEGTRVFVSGQNSRWLNSSRLTMRANAFLSVYNEGFVESHGATMEGGQLHLGPMIIIDGANSKWDNQGDLDVEGFSGLRIENGGSFVNGNASFSKNAGDSTSIFIRGADSNWLNETLTLGDLGQASLTILNGGFAQTSDTVIGKQYGGSGTILVNGSGSRWQSTGDIVLGTGGTATMSIQDGGLVQSVNASIATGNSTPFSANVSLTGSNSRWENSGDLFVGGSATLAGYTGRLNVDTGSTVSVGGDSKVWVTGRINITGGTFNAGTGFENQGQVNLNSGSLNNLGNIYSQSFGSTKINGGTLTTGSLYLTGGDLTIQGGRLDVSNYKLADFDAVTAVSGSMAGLLTNQAGDDLNATGYMSTGVSNSFDARDVTIANAGSLFGNSRLVGSLDNQTTGDVRVAAGEKMQFATTNAIHANRGVIEAIGNFAQFAEIEFNGGLINDASGLIAARNATLRFDGGLTNLGSLGVSFGTTDVVGDVLNLGNISVGGGAEATFFGDVAQNGNMTVAKVGSRISSAVILGEFSGGGFVGGGDVFVLGDLRPGFSPASVQMDGNLFLGSSTNTLIEIGGTAIGEFDQMLVSGDFSIDGQLGVQMWSNYQLLDGTEFLIAEIGGLQNGAFSGLGEGDLVGTFGGVGLFITYTGGDGNDVSLFTAVPEPGSLWTLSVLALAISIRRKRRLLV